MANDSSNRIQSVELAFKIIESLQELDGAGVSELADYLDLNKSTAHVYLKTLSNIGYLTRNNEEYHIGLRFLEPGGFARQRLSVFQAGKNQIDSLSEETGDVVALGVENLGRRVIIYKSDGEETVPTFYEKIASLGVHLPMNWTAIGKAILSTKSDSQIQTILDRHGLPQATEHTITNPETLFEELATIREQGYAIEDEEYKLGSRAVGVPIEGYEPTAAVSVAGPKHRLSLDRIEEEIIDKLNECTNIINLRLEGHEDIALREEAP